MDRSTKAPSGGAPRQPWNPEQAPRGVSCPACGLANEPGARVCRNCGLPIAGASDPLRGVMPGRVDLPTAQRSGLSATIGLALVIGLLVVGGTLAVSGGGILSTGGRLGVDAPATASPDAGSSSRPDGDADPATPPPGGEDPGDETPGDETPGGATASRGTSFDYTCEDAAITDLGDSRWSLSLFRAGLREEDDETYERITWEMAKRGGAKEGTTATMEWTTPREAKAQGATLVNGDRAIVVTFDGPVDTSVGQEIDQLLLEPEGVTTIRTIDMFEGEDGKVRTVIGIRGEGCVRMSSLGWTRKGTAKNARIFLDVERP
jgi:hypothetical protein